MRMPSHPCSHCYEMMMLEKERVGSHSSSCDVDYDDDDDDDDDVIAARVGLVLNLFVRSLARFRSSAISESECFFVEKGRKAKYTTTTLACVAGGRLL